MYYIDSIPRKVYTFDYNEQEGTLTNQRVCIDFAKDDSVGLPDGMCVDIHKAEPGLLAPLAKR